MYAVNFYILYSNGFDKICKIYTEVYTDPKYAKLSQGEKTVLIDDKVHSSVFSVDAITAYSAVVTADPRYKYELLKKSAEVSLNHKWDCSELAKLQRDYNSKHKQGDD